METHTRVVTRSFTITSCTDRPGIPTVTQLRQQRQRHHSACRPTSQPHRCDPLHMTSTSASPTDDELIDARDNWTSDQWDAHFKCLGKKAATIARYDDSTERNDVLKWAIAEVDGRKCWYQGSSDCASRALLLRNLQIDHIIPKKSKADFLRMALKHSLNQSVYFDVHDPGNLALICGPCNTERKKHPRWSPALETRLETAEERRVTAINKVSKWYEDSGIDEAALKALTLADVSDDATWEVLASMAGHLIEKRAGKEVTLAEAEVAAESQTYGLSASVPSDVWESIAEDLEEGVAEDRRLERHDWD